MPRNNRGAPIYLASGSPQDESVRLVDKGLLDPPLPVLAASGYARVDRALRARC